VFQIPCDRLYLIYRRFIVYIIVKLDYISSFISQPIGFLIILNTYITRGLFYIYVIYLYNILVIIENLLQYIKNDPFDIYPDPLYLYNRVLDNILKVFLCSNSFSIKNI
jgi:hypothetical protein